MNRYSPPNFSNRKFSEPVISKHQYATILDIINSEDIGGFIELCKKYMCDEQIKFLCDVNEYNKNPTYNTALTIITKYIIEDAPSDLGMSKNVRIRILDSFHKGEIKNIFNQASLAVDASLQDILSGFNSMFRSKSIFEKLGL